MASPVIYSSQGSAPYVGGSGGSGPSHGNRGRKNIISGRGVNLGEVRDPELMVYLNYCGWQRFHENFPVTYYPGLVYEFYQNATFPRRVGETDPILQTQVRGVHIQLGLQQIAQIFNIPNQGEKIYFKIKGLAENLLPGEGLACFYMNIIGSPGVEGQMRNVDVREDRRILNAYVRANIVPKSGGHSDEVPTFQGFVMHCLATGRQLNLPYIILKAMEHGKTDSRKSLPYGGFLTRIFMMFGVEIPNDEPTANCELPISEYTITQQGVQRRSSRHRNRDPPQHVGGDGGDGGHGGGDGGGGYGGGDIGPGFDWFRD